MERKIIKEMEILKSIVERSKSTNLRCATLCYFNNMKKFFPNDKRISKLCRSLNISSIKFIFPIIYNGFRLVHDENVFVKKNKKYIDSVIPKVCIKENWKNIYPMEYGEMMNIFYSFLKYISSDLYLFANKIINDAKIFIKKDNVSDIFNMQMSNNGITTCVLPQTGHYYTFLNNFKDIRDILIFFHEIGHLYYYYINKIDQFEVKDASFRIKEEVPSKMLERLFISYLKTFYPPYGDILEEYDNNLILYDTKLKDDFKRLKYSLGDFVSYMLNEYINKNLSLEDFMKYVYNTDYYDILNNANIAFNNKEKKKQC